MSRRHRGASDSAAQCGIAPGRIAVRGTAGV